MVLRYKHPNPEKKFYHYQTVQLFTQDMDLKLYLEKRKKVTLLSLEKWISYKKMTYWHWGPLLCIYMCKSFCTLQITIYIFNILKTKNIDIPKFKTLMSKFVKKSIKKKITKKKIKEKMFSKNIFLYLKYYSPLKMINYIFA